MRNADRFTVAIITVAVARRENGKRTVKGKRNVNDMNTEGLRRLVLPFQVCVMDFNCLFSNSLRGESPNMYSKLPAPDLTYVHSYGRFKFY